MKKFSSSQPRLSFILLRPSMCYFLSRLFLPPAHSDTGSFHSSYSMTQGGEKGESFPVCQGLRRERKYRAEGEDRATSVCVLCGEDSVLGAGRKCCTIGRLERKKKARVNVVHCRKRVDGAQKNLGSSSLCAPFSPERPRRKRNGGRKDWDLKRTDGRTLPRRRRRMPQEKRAFLGRVPGLFKAGGGRLSNSVLLLRSRSPPYLRRG